jgi:hypothetical protein
MTKRSALSSVRLLKGGPLKQAFIDGGSVLSGKGLHAKDGKAKIRPALEKLCEE